MNLASKTSAALHHTDRFFIGGEWVEPSSDATIGVVDSTSEEVFLTVAEARDVDMSRSVTAARQAFDPGPWPKCHTRSGLVTCEPWRRGSERAAAERAVPRASCPSWKRRL